MAQPWYERAREVHSDCRYQRCYLGGSGANKAEKVALYNRTKFRQGTTRGKNWKFDRGCDVRVSSTSLETSPSPERPCSEPGGREGLPRRYIHAQHVCRGKKTRSNQSRTSEIHSKQSRLQNETRLRKLTSTMHTCLVFTDVPPAFLRTPGWLP